MAKYVRARHGNVFMKSRLADVSPVVVIPEADWRALLKHLECKVPWDSLEIDAIIQRTEEANNG